MDLSHWLWIATAAYGIHILEEFALNWRDWARTVIGLPVEWPDFYVTNALVIVLGVTAANLASAAPGLALAFPALMLINAVFFHILPIVKAKGRFSPGAITAVILFLPIGIYSFVVANRAGLLTASSLIGSFVLAALLMATPVVLLKVKSRPYFRQDRG